MDVSYQGSYCIVRFFCRVLQKLSQSSCTTLFHVIIVLACTSNENANILNSWVQKGVKVIWLWFFEGTVNQELWGTSFSQKQTNNVVI